jgi:hypothetical protein
MTRVGFDRITRAPVLHANPCAKLQYIVGLYVCKVTLPEHNITYTRFVEQNVCVLYDLRSLNYLFRMCTLL